MKLTPEEELIVQEAMRKIIALRESKGARADSQSEEKTEEQNRSDSVQRVCSGYENSYKRSRSANARKQDRRDQRQDASHSSRLGVVRMSGATQHF